MLIKDCIEKQVAGVTMFTSGFAETGTPEGIEAQRIIAQMVREAGLVLFGPNCMGVYDPKKGLRFATEQTVGEGGPVAFISQSGGHGVAFSLAAEANGVGINKLVSFGNGAALEVTDYLEYFSQDDNTEIIAMYIEGVNDGRRFFQLLRETTPRKPVVIWKGGQTVEGGRATSSHTGALAGSADTWKTVINQAGAIGVDSLTQMFDVLRALIYLPMVTGDGLGLMVRSGGQSVSMTDAFAKEGFRIPSLEEGSYKKFENVFNLVGGSCSNPIDTGSMNQEHEETIMEILASDSNVDMVVVQIGFVASKRSSQWIDWLVKPVLRVRDRVNKPFVCISGLADPCTDSDALSDLSRELHQTGIPTYPSYERAAYAVRKLVDYYRFHAA